MTSTGEETVTTVSCDSWAFESSEPLQLVDVQFTLKLNCDAGHAVVVLVVRAIRLQEFRVNLLKGLWNEARGNAND